MHKSLLIMAFLLVTTISSAATLTNLQTEHLVNPLSVSTPTPRLSWQIDSDQSDESQSAYQIRAASSLEKLAAAPDLWQSAKISSDQSVLVPWAGASLTSRAEIFWQVRTWNQNDLPTDWSAPARFELGLLNPASDWHAQWITNSASRFDQTHTPITGASWIWADSADATRPALFRKTITIPPGVKIRDAQCDISGQSGFVLYVNGKIARQASGRPNGWQHLTHGYFLPQMHEGQNTLVLSAPPAVPTSAIIASFSIELDNGARINILTDASWKASVPTSVAVDAACAEIFDDSAWLAAKALAKFGDNPWSAITTEESSGPGRYLLKSFSIQPHLAKARLYATALGLYQIALNGKPITDNQFTPGWTEYTQRIMVQAYDVTGQLHEGNNTCAALLTDGWYAGRVGWMGLSQYGTVPAFAAQLELTYDDGHSEILTTDANWKTTSGPVLAADLQWGEVIDHRQPDPLTQTTFDDSQLQPALLATNLKAGKLVPNLGPPVRSLLALPPQSLKHIADAATIDFGQNLVGHIRLTAQGPAGTAITIRHAEFLNPDGTLYTANLRPARATDTFILSGNGTETFEPAHTFHGFRYVEIANYPGELSADNIKAIVVGSDNPPTGTFECSDPRINRLFQNITWSQRGNFLSVPTDCPQRDERMGWMGDAEVFAPTAAYNADVSAFFTKWLMDVDDAQTPQGAFSNFSPRANQSQPGVPGWADAGVIIPWAMYEAYGDQQILADHYPAMVRFVEYLGQNTTGNVRPRTGIGDHLAPPALPLLPPNPITPTDLVATAFYAHSIDLTANAAAVLGKTDDAKKYRRLFNDVSAAYTAGYISSDGTVKGETQSGYLFSLAFHLVPDTMRPRLAQHLIADIEKRGHLTTGFLGISLLCPTLTDIGRPDLAYKLLLTDTYPSWLFPIKFGATTIWERWDGYTPEKGFQDPAMNSFNHYSLGSIGEWFYSGIAGINPDNSSSQTAGYKHIILHPHPTRAFAPNEQTTSFAHTTYTTPYGKLISNWQIDKEQGMIDITIPPNSTATIISPDGFSSLLLKPGPHHVTYTANAIK